ncbi:dna polymerase iv [Trichoderma cornu-damae]|uniref:DNA polymerase lambda n=1 Tax=Trichoderma cornu-damae TaxID=654480 RepID=A0A9P8QNI7_9HYPO|nr:dna polymerase iv [Trichoderma cornu-damae]
MDNSEPTSLESKAAYFDRLKRLAHVNDGYANGRRSDDDFDAREEGLRELHRGFFRPAPGPSARQGHGQQQRQQQQQQQESPERDGQSLPGKQSRLRNLTPRRVLAAPQPGSGHVVKGTGPGKPRPKGRLAALLDKGPDVVCETPLVGAEKTRRRKGTREESASLKRPLGSASEGESSPSVNAKAGTAAATANGRKRGRVSGPRARPEAEQIFKGLSFFYIPDDDIAPARRLRIHRAKEFGATWTRDLTTATHVVVEKKLEYKDVEKMWPREGFGSRTPPKVVNEDYPLDCIQFRAILDPGQKKYLVNGQAAAAATEEDERPRLITEPKAKPLQLKPQHHNKRKWDYVPRRGMPSQGEEEAEAEAEADPQAGGPMGDVSRHDAKLQGGGSPGDVGRTEPLSPPPPPPPPPVRDELSEYISMMQEFNGLPLDVDEDDDGRSISNDSESEAQADVDQPSGPENEPPRKGRLSGRARPTGKAIAFEDRFACNRAGRQDANEDNPNARTIEILQKMNGYYERVNDQWRTMAYRKAIGVLRQQHVKITTEEEAYRLPSIGRRLAQKIAEIAATDRLKRLEHAEREPADHALQTFLKVYGVGSKVAEQWIAHGWRTLDDVRQHAKLTPSQAVGVEHYDDLNTRIPRREVAALGDVVKEAAARIDPAVRLIIGGSYRRGAESSHDVDLIVTKPGTESAADLRPFLRGLLGRLERDGFLVARLASSRSGGDGSKWHGCCVLPDVGGLDDGDDGDGDAGGHGEKDMDKDKDKDEEKKGRGGHRPIWRRIDFLLVPEVELGAALIYFTGNDIFNRSIRLLASKKGMRLNQRGLYRDVLRGPNRAKVTEGQLVERRDERRIFEILGVEWREPWERWC